MIKTTLFLILTVPLMLQAQDSTQTLEGFVSIESDPAGAEVYLDSVRVGVTPIERLETSEGRHLVQVFYRCARPQSLPHPGPFLSIARIDPS